MISRPALTLCLLAPIVAEVLSGATRVSFLFALAPEIMVWGCGTLIIREIVIRWRGGWSSILLLGLALSVAEEFIIQQTSIAPLPWLGAAPAYGRAWGVNWIYFLYMLGYESVWVVVVPTQLTYLIFPDRRDGPWLGKRGLAAALLVFLAGSFIAWFTWTQQARTVVFHAAKYDPPHSLIGAGLLAIALLVGAAWRFRNSDPQASGGRAPGPRLAGAGVFLVAMPWWILITLVFVPNPPVPAQVSLCAGVVWGLFAYGFLRRWSSGGGWSDLHRWAVVFAAILVCMIGGFAGSSTWPRIDLIGKVIANVVAVGGLVVLERRVARGE